MKSKRPYDMTARLAKSQATRERIRASAMALYIDSAIEEFTLEEVAKRAEITVQTILRIFGSKEDLLFAALGELAETGLSLKATPAGDIPAAVSAILSAIS